MLQKKDLLNKITQYLRQALKVLTFIVGMVVIVVICYAGYLMLDDKAWCLSEGHGVWDADKRECRQDCLTWREDIGCVPITKENITKKEKELL